MQAVAGLGDDLDHLARQPVEPGATSQPGFFAIWGSGASDIFAVGDLGGVIWHYNGSSWAQMAAGTTAVLYGVSGSGPTDVTPPTPGWFPPT